MKVKGWTYILLLAATLVSCGGEKLIQKTADTPRAESAEFQGKFFDAQAEKAKGNSEKAYQLFQEALAISPDNHAVMYEVARLDLEFGKDPSAQNHIEQAIELDPKNQWYRLLMADICARLGDLGCAKDQYETILKLNPEDINVRYEIANIHLYNGDFEKAIEQFTEIESYIGVNEYLAIEKRRLYYEMGKPEEAEKELLRLVDSFPDNVNYKGMLADHYLAMGEEEKAVQIYESIRSTDPENGMLHLKLSEYYATKGDDERSYEEIVLAFQSSDVDIDRKIGILLNFYQATEFDPSQLERAYNLLEITELAHPKEAKALAMSGDFLLRDNRLAEARDKFRKAVGLDASRNLIWTQLLQLEIELNDFKALKTEGKRASELFPTFPEYYLYQGVGCVQLGEHQEAVDALLIGKEFVIDNALMSSQFYSSLGDSYHALEKHEKSDESYEEALRYDPGNVFVMNNYAYYLSLRKTKLNRAKELAAKANELEPGSISFEDTYGWVLFQLGEYEEAKKWLEKAMSHGGEKSGEILEHMGDVQFKLGAQPKALEFWKKALEAGGGSDLLEKKVNEEQWVE